MEFGDDHWRQAGMAFARYGKGRHPAAFGQGCVVPSIPDVAFVILNFPAA